MCTTQQAKTVIRKGHTLGSVPIYCLYEAWLEAVHCSGHVLDGVAKSQRYIVPIQTGMYSADGTDQVQVQ